MAGSSDQAKQQFMEHLLQEAKKHPGFKAVAAKIAKRPGIRNAGAVLAAATRKAGGKARKANPKLNKVKG